jgi:hypothetical protein
MSYPKFKQTNSPIQNSKPSLRGSVSVQGNNEQNKNSKIQSTEAQGSDSSANTSPSYVSDAQKKLSIELEKEIEELKSLTKTAKEIAKRKSEEESKLKIIENNTLSTNIVSSKKSFLEVKEKSKENNLDKVSNIFNIFS